MSVTAKFVFDGEVVHEFSSTEGEHLAPVQSLPEGCRYKGRHDHGPLPQLRQPPSALVEALHAAKADSDTFLSAEIQRAKAAKSGTRTGHEDGGASKKQKTTGPS